MSGKCEHGLTLKECFTCASPKYGAHVVAIKKPPNDLSKQLRALADQADAGSLTDMVLAYCVDGGYEFLYAASLHNCLVMAAMLNQNCIDRMRA